MGLKVLLKVVRQDMVEEVEVEVKRGDIPHGVVIEDKKKTKRDSNNKSKRLSTSGESIPINSTHSADDMDTHESSSEAAEQEGPAQAETVASQEPDEPPKSRPADTTSPDETPPLTAEKAKDEKAKNEKEKDNTADFTSMSNDEKEKKATRNLSATNPSPTSGSLLPNKDYAMTISSTGKYSRKATWKEIASFAGVDQVDSDTLKDWLHSYLKQNFPDQLTKANCTPRTCWIQDIPKLCVDVYNTYGWKPVKLQLQPGMIDVREQSTKEIVLEQLEWNCNKDLETLLQQDEKGDQEVTSSLRKSKLAGHPLALSMMKTDSQITTEFRGMDSVVFRLGNNQTAATIEDETGDEVWTDTKKLRALLKGTPMPKKTGKGGSRTIDVLASESRIMARVYYKASFTGTVSTDHGNEQFDGRRYWNWDLKYFLRYNDIPNAIVVYEDIDLHFYSQVRLNMENEDWEWVNKRGSWMKQKLNDPGADQ